MKKFIIAIIMIVTIMTMTGCSEKEETKISNDPPVIVTETIEVENIEVEEITTENVNVSKEYLEELEYNSQKNQW